MLIIRNPPQNIQDSHKKYFEIVKQIELPELSLIHHKYSLLLANGVLIDKNGFCRESLLYNNRINDKLFVFRIFKYILKKIICVSLSFKVSDYPRVSVINEWTTNYFHWITEALPRIIYAKEKIGYFKLLLPEIYKNYHYILETLDLLEIEVLWFSKGLLFINNILIPSRQAPYSAHYNPEYILKVHSQIINRIKLDFKIGDRIYIARKKSAFRKIENENEVINLVTSYDFKVVEYENFSFNEQVSISYNASVLMSIHGAGLTNMIFGKKGMLVYEFSLQNQYLDKCYYTLSEACQHNYYYQFCDSTDLLCSYQESNLIVDIETLRQNMISLFGY